jgi:hypothetical protein
MIKRLKFYLEELVDRMINQLPDELFKSDSTTFLDPSMAGGQFVKAVEERLRKYGHSDSNISKRVFGLVENELRLNYVKNTHKLNGNYSVCTVDDFFENKSINNMDFNVVLTNPPFNNGNTGNGGAGSLWFKFIDKGMEYLKEGGYLCYVTPSSWMGKLDSKNFKTFTDYSVISVNTDTGKYFDVGSTFSNYIIKKEKPNDDFRTNFIDLGMEINLKEHSFLPLVPEHFSIVKNLRIKSNSRYVIKFDGKPAHSTWMKNSPDRLSPTKTSRHIYRALRVGANEIVWVDGNEPSDYGTPKVALAITRADINPTYYEDPIGCNDNHNYITVKNKDEGKKVEELLAHPIYKFLLKTHKYIGFQPAAVLGTIDIPVDVEYDKLYEYFEVTDEDKAIMLDYISVRKKKHN